jgi:hypothetical protein
MSAAINHRTALVLTLIAALSAGCAEPGAKQITTMPRTSTSAEAGAAHRAVVMFRAVVDVDGKLVQEPFSPFHSMLFLTSVGPKDAILTPGHGLLPGRFDSTADSNAGWAFLALPPGTYQFAFEGLGVRFVMTGARQVIIGGAPIGLSSAAVFVVPHDVRAIYIGTFSLRCHKGEGFRGAPSAECTSLELRDESELAREIAQTTLSQFWPLQELSVSMTTQFTR